MGRRVKRVTAFFSLADEFSALFGGNLTIIVRHGKFSNRTTYVVITKADPVVTVVTT